MKKSFHSALRVALVLGLMVRVVAAAAQTQSAAPSNLAQLTLERHLTLSPSSDNRRNSEGDFVHLKDGRWLFIYTHFTSGANDHSKAFLASRESSDGGKTWSQKDKTVVANEGGFNVMSVSLLRLKSGEIALFYLRKNSLQDCRPMLRLSRDEAKTWSNPIECITDETGYYVLNNCRVVQLSGGRIVMPTALHAFENGHLQPGRIVVYLSDDTGRSWRRSATVLDQDASGTRINLMEPGVAEVSTNRMLMVIRTRLGRQYFSESNDKGQSWTKPHPSDLLSPEAPATLARIPSTGDLLVVWNDHDDQPESVRLRRPPLRTRLAVAISRDGGATWVNRKKIEVQPDHGYCYTAVAFADNRVLLGYCAHTFPNYLEATQISSFSVQDLYR